jgi:two-component system chemotaxis sensor kinase CheA
MLESRELGPALEEVGELIEAAMYAADETPAAPSAARENPGGLPAEADIELLSEWTVESLEYLDAAENALLALETEPTDAEAINVVFRGFHTIKGTAAFLGLEMIVDLAHYAESLLSRVRDGEVPFTPDYADLSLRTADLLRELVHGTQAALGGEQFPLPEGYAEILEKLIAYDEDSNIVLDDQHATPSLVASIPPKGSRPAQPPYQQKRDTAKRRPTSADIADSTIRVRTDRLDRLMDLVGELVVAQSMIAQDDTLTSGQHLQLEGKVDLASKLVRELQGLSTAMRMVPLQGTFRRLARLVRDLSRATSKQVELITEGEDTEIDRNMVDIVADPLVHMVRNAIDHGIELPDERRAIGKPESGIVRLAAYHQGSSVVVELSDDGRGLDREAIAARAVSRGLIETGDELSDSEIYRLIFAPGFSTAEQVTDVSGRGVGMDVVRRNIESLQGRVDVSSEPGRGSTFTFRLPLTLAITEGMLVRVGSERYIVPTGHIYQSFRPQAKTISTVIGKGEVVLHHGQIIPLVRLHSLFDITDAEADPTHATLMLVGDTTRRGALLVDDILGQHQFVAKPLGEGLGAIDGLAGAAVLGDGRVGLILDITSLLSIRQARPVLMH